MMNRSLESYRRYWDVNGAVLSRYLTVVVVLATALIGYFLVEENYRYLAFLLVPVVFLLSISIPRLAVYQFILLMFSNRVFLESPVVLYVDLSACILIFAAALDFMFEGSLPRRFPRLTVNWVLLVVVFFLAAVFAYDPILGIKPLLRFSLMSVTFFSLYRLARHFSLRHLVTFFFWVGVANAIIALAQLAPTGEAVRTFGFAAKTLDDLMMICLPVGLSLYLWSPGRKGFVYLLGAIPAIVALIATQSRFPIIFAVGFSMLAIFVSWRLVIRRGKMLAANSASEAVDLRVVRKRIVIALAAVSLCVLVVAAIRPELIRTVWLRFESLLRGDLAGTAQLRLSLWKSALQAFRDHPILGIGPGNFDVVHRIYQQLHLDPAQVYIRGLSAHNLLLHYMAETGLAGSSVVLALFINQLRLARRAFQNREMDRRPEFVMILYIVAVLFFVTACIEAAWMWGQPSFVFVFFLVLIVRSHERSATLPVSSAQSHLE